MASRCRLAPIPEYVAWNAALRALSSFPKGCREDLSAWKIPFYGSGREGNPKILLEFPAGIFGIFWVLPAAFFWLGFAGMVWREKLLQGKVEEGKTTLYLL